MLFFIDNFGIFEIFIQIFTVKNVNAYIIIALKITKVNSLSCAFGIRYNQQVGLRINLIYTGLKWKL